MSKEYKFGSVPLSYNWFTSLKFGDSGGPFLCSRKAIIVCGNVATPGVVYTWSDESRPCAYEQLLPHVTVNRSKSRRREDHNALSSALSEALRGWCERIEYSVKNDQVLSPVYMFPDDFIPMKLPSGMCPPSGLNLTYCTWPVD